MAKSEVEVAEEQRAATAKKRAAADRANEEARRDAIRKAQAEAQAKTHTPLVTSA